MARRGSSLRRWALLALLAAAFASSGCTAIARGIAGGFTYLQYRVEDLAEVADIGISFSSEPSLGVYACFASLACAGFADVNGYCLGMAGGKVGLIRMRVKAVGQMLYGMEDVSWGTGSSRRHYRHPMGLYAVGNTYRLPPPAYCPACTHYIHLICVGFVGNLRYAEILDFVLGFTTMDIACDDGRAMGRWAFQ